MDKIFIFGAGKRGRELLQLLYKYEAAEVAAFIDNNVELQGSLIEGKNCISVDEAVKEGVQNEIIIISTACYKEIEQQLKSRSFRKVFSWSRLFPSPLYSVPDILDPTDYKNVCPFNNYDSPYPNIKEIHDREKEIFNKGRFVLDVDFNISRQIELLKKMERIELPEWEKNTGGGYRYAYENEWFRKGSADALCYMMQILRPNNIIEIGSGYSTAVMLDTNEKYFENRVKIVSIEPRAERLKSLLKPSDNLNIIEFDLQKISVDFFDTLRENDILFVDSSHVSRIGSDVNYILFEILPRLKKKCVYSFS